MKNFEKIKKAYTKAATKATNDFKALVKKNGTLVKQNNATLNAVKTRITQDNMALDSETTFANKMLEDIKG